MFIVLFKRKVLFNSYLIPFKGKEGVKEIFLYKDQTCLLSPINIKYNNLFETFFLFFSQCFFPMGNYKGSKLGTTSLLIHFSVLCTVWTVYILRRRVLWTGWESLGRNWSTTMPPASCNTQKSASCIRPVEICLTISTVYFCSLFLYLFLIQMLTSSPACRGK